MQKMPPKKLAVTPTIDDSAIVHDCSLGAWTEIGPRTKVIESVMGDYSYVVNDSDIIYSEIGKFVNIASNVRLNPGQHPMDRASMHHFQYRSDAYDMGADDLSFFDWRRSHRLVIGHDVWIGHGAIVMGDVTIGTGSVIAAGAVVTKDVAPYTVVAGVPATPLRPRFDQDIQDAMQRIAWWDWSYEEIAARMDDFRNLDSRAFCAKYDPAA